MFGSKPEIKESRSYSARVNLPDGTNFYGADFMGYGTSYISYTGKTPDEIRRKVRATIHSLTMLLEEMETP